MATMTSFGKYKLDPEEEDKLMYYIGDRKKKQAVAKGKHDKGEFSRLGGVMAIADWYVEHGYLTQKMLDNLQRWKVLKERATNYPIIGGSDLAQVTNKQQESIFGIGEAPYYVFWHTLNGEKGKLKLKAKSMLDATVKASKKLPFAFIDKAVLVDLSEQKIDNGQTKRQVVKQLYKHIHPLTTKIYTDEYWHGSKAVFHVFDKLGLKWHLTGSRYDTASPPTYKVWSFEVEFLNQKSRVQKITGYIMAHGAGSVEDPLDKYDITVQMG